MLGNIIYESKGQITNQRVIGIEGPTLEISLSSNGIINGEIEVTETVTYESTPQQGGIIYGEGQGILMTKDGNELVTVQPQGIGKYTGSGSVRFAGSVFFNTISNGKLAFLNDIVGVFEYEMDVSGATHIKVWEWK